MSGLLLCYGMLTSISVVGQHPVGLDITLDNLRWAINRPKRLVVFTFKAYGFDKSRYPDVEFIEVDADPKHYHKFLSLEIKDYLRKTSDDLVIFTEMDTFFVKQIGDEIDHIRNTEDIHCGIMKWWYDLLKDGKVVVPRIWEGGLICPVKHILNCYDMGIEMGHEEPNPALIKRFLENDLRFEIGQIGRTIGEKFQVGNEFHTDQGDHFSSMQVYCYVMGIKVRGRNYIAHIKSPETIHRWNPKLYTDINNRWQELIELTSDRGTGTIFHMYLLGLVSQEVFDLSSQQIKDHWRKEIFMLNKFADQWMRTDILARYRHALGKIC
jgi:hypothetical protein